MNDPGSDEIRQLFEAQKAADRRQAPRLDDLLSRPVRPPWRGESVWRAAAALSVLVLAIALFLVFRPQPQPQLAGLSHWESPTQFLLSIPTGSLLQEAPRMLDEHYPSAEILRLAADGSSLLGQDSADGSNSADEEK